MTSETATIAISTGPRKRGPNRMMRRTLVAGFLLTVTIVVAGVWTADAVREAVEDDLRQDLAALIASQANAVSLWLEDRMDRLDAIAATSEARTFMLADGPAREDPELQVQLRERINEIMPEHVLAGGLVDTAGSIVLSHPPERLLGRSLNETGMEQLAKILAGERSIGRARKSGELIDDVPDPIAVAVISMTTAVHDSDGVPIGAIFMSIDPEERFTELLIAAAREHGGTSFAFDDDGVLLSHSRYEDELRDLGLLPRDQSTKAIMNVVLRDPGGDLTGNYKPDLPWEQWPLTQMVRRAVAGEDGIDLDGYRDMRGVRVVGAWKWLPQWGMGVAVELDERQALRAERPVRIATRILVALLGVAGAVVIFFMNRIERLKTRITEVQQLGQYTLQRKLGEGGMGSVYLARHAMLRRPCVLKMIRPDTVGEDAIARFEQEVQLTSDLTHPNTIEIYDYGRTEHDIFYYVMEYLDGPSLEQIIEGSGPMPPGRVAHLIRQACGSLHEAHEAGLIHRDIKPGNIMACRLGGMVDVTKVIDFGLVKEANRDARIDVTGPQGVVGTPIYLAPEALAGAGEFDTRLDIYALGAVMFYLLSGRTVFEGGSPQQLAERTVYGEVPRVSTIVPDVPPAFDDLVADCLEKKPDDRPATTAIIAERLAAIMASCPWGDEQAGPWWDTWSAEHPAPAAGTDAGLSADTIRIDPERRG